MVAVDRGGQQVFDAEYDYRTRRLTKTEGSETTVYRYDGGTSFQELDDTGSITLELIRGTGMGGGIGSILYTDRHDPTSLTTEYFAYNAVGHTVALTDTTGNVTKTNAYEAFGAVVAESGSSANNKLANTKERDATTALDNHGFRYYDPSTGRYITRDPIGYGDGPNVYLYVGGNPVNRVDPEGLEATEEGFLIENRQYWAKDQTLRSIHRDLTGPTHRYTLSYDAFENQVRQAHPDLDVSARYTGLVRWSRQTRAASTSTSTDERPMKVGPGPAVSGSGEPSPETTSNPVAAAASGGRQRQSGPYSHGGTAGVAAIYEVNGATRSKVLMAEVNGEAYSATVGVLDVTTSDKEGYGRGSAYVDVAQVQGDVGWHNSVGAVALKTGVEGEAGPTWLSGIAGGDVMAFGADAEAGINNWTFNLGASAQWVEARGRLGLRIDNYPIKFEGRIRAGAGLKVKAGKLTGGDFGPFGVYVQFGEGPLKYSHHVRQSPED